MSNTVVENMASTKVATGTVFVGVGSGMGAMFDWIQDGGLTVILASILSTVVIVSSIIKSYDEHKKHKLKMRLLKADIELVREQIHQHKTSHPR